MKSPKIIKLLEGYRIVERGKESLFFLNLNLAPTQQSSSQTNSSGSIPLRLGLGFISGSIASIANIPFDVAKSRIQGNLKKNKFFF